MTYEQKTYYAKIFCRVSHPLLIPIYSCIIGWLLFFSPVRMSSSILSAFAKGVSLSVYVIYPTILFLLPVVLVKAYRRYYKNVYPQQQIRQMKAMPDIITLTCLVLGHLHQKAVFLPYVITCITLAAVIIFVLHILIRKWFDFSLHTAAWGGVAGALIAYSFILMMFNPVWWICFAFFMGGCVGSCRMFLGYHNLSEVVGGFAIGAVVAHLSVVIS